MGGPKKQCRPLLQLLNSGQSGSTTAERPCREGLCHCCVQQTAQKLSIRPRNARKPAAAKTARCEAMVESIQTSRQKERRSAVSRFVRCLSLCTACSPSSEEDSSEHPVFGKALHESLQYASVQISTADSKGELYVWGYIPVVVAKWSVHCRYFDHLADIYQWALSQRERSVPRILRPPETDSIAATEVPGTFRVNGSNRRMRELQAAFETQPRVRQSPRSCAASLTSLQYGKSLVWNQESYTTHDVASVFRRYLTQMPVGHPLRTDD